MGFAQMMEVFEKLPEETRKAFIMLMEEFEKRFNLMEKMATKDEMNSLKEVVAELAEAQKRTEERLNELAEAQKRTEERLSELAQRVDELAEAPFSSRSLRIESEVTLLPQPDSPTSPRVSPL